jgi:uncharacterized protein
LTDQSFNPNLIIPVGTQVVTRVEIKGIGTELAHPRGAVGKIVESPVDNSHAYRVQFLDGVEASLSRSEFSVRKQFQKDAISNTDSVLADFNLYDYVIYQCIVGSRAYGLDETGSDTDRRGIYLPPATMEWSLYGVPEQLENSETEECYWELQKFLVLALKANPNVLECLYTPLIELATPLAQELLDMRLIFLSQLIYQTYNGYVMSQFKKLEQDLRNRGEIKWKHAMHLIRLLLSGIIALRENYIMVNVGEYRDRLLAIRRGELSWEEVNAWRLSLHKEFDEAFRNTTLPQRPDYEKANSFLIKARATMV